MTLRRIRVSLFTASSASLSRLSVEYSGQVSDGADCVLVCCGGYGKRVERMRDRTAVTSR